MGTGLAGAMAASFVLDFALLWATAQIGGFVAPARRLVLGAGLGALGLALLPAPLPPAGTAAAVLALAVLMPAVALQPKTLRSLLRAVGTLWAAAFVAAGAGLAVSGLVVPEAAPYAALESAVAALVTGAWWTRRRLATVRVEQTLRLQLQVRFGARKIVLDGLVDTGNRLRDPMTGLPVVLVAPRALARAMGPVHARLLQGVASGDVSVARRLAGLSPEWARRFRVVPFEGVGIRRGVLGGFRADEVAIRRAGHRGVRRVSPAVVAIAPNALPRDGIEALVPVEYVVDPPVPSGAPDAPPIPTGGGMVGVKAS